jgi:hypothetical protein
MNFTSYLAQNRPHSMHLEDISENLFDFL